MSKKSTWSRTAHSRRVTKGLVTKSVSVKRCYPKRKKS